MLRLDSPIAGLAGAFEDHAVAGLVQVLPAALDLQSSSAGVPELSLVLHSAGVTGAGGLFQARFAAIHAGPPGMAWQPAEVTAARLRLTLRTPVDGAGGLSAWRNVVTDGRGAMVVTFPLTPREAEVLRDCALGQANAVEVAVELDHAGMLGGLPFLARAPQPAVLAQLGALLADGAHTADAVASAFLSLSAGMFTFARTGDGPQPTTEALLRETAARALPLLFDRVTGPDGARYRLAEGTGADEVLIRLDLPRVEVRPHRLAWDMRRLTATLTDDAAVQRHFPLMRAVRPFERVTLRAVNTLPLDPDHLRRVSVDVAYTGPGGTPLNTTLDFLPGDGAVKGFDAVYPALTHPFVVQSRIKLMIAPLSGGGFPVIWPKPPVFEAAADPLSIDLSARRAGVAVVQLRALAGVFDACRAVQCTLGLAGGTVRAKVDAAKPEAWVILPGHAEGAPLDLRLEALPLEGGVAPRVIRQERTAASQVVVSPVDVAVTEPDRIEVRLVGDTIVFAVIEARRPGGHARAQVLRPGVPVHFAIWRASIFDGLVFEWRMDAVRRGPDGRTQPMDSGAWQTATAPLLEIAA